MKSHTQVARQVYDKQGTTLPQRAPLGRAGGVLVRYPVLALARSNFLALGSNFLALARSTRSLEANN